jgi:hypothetical protein
MTTPLSRLAEKPTKLTSAGRVSLIVTPAAVAGPWFAKLRMYCNASPLRGVVGAAILLRRRSAGSGGVYSSAPRSHRVWLKGRA